MHLLFGREAMSADTHTHTRTQHRTDAEIVAGLVREAADMGRKAAYHARRGSEELAKHHAVIAVRFAMAAVEEMESEK